MRTVDVLGIPFIYTTQKDFVDLLVERAERQEKTFVVTANPEVVMKAKEDQEFNGYLQKATYITPDGIGVVKGAQILGDPLPERVTGYDSMVAILKKANERKQSIYLLGASPETIELTVTNIRRDYHDVTVAGYHHGFFDWDSSEIADDIKVKQPDYIFVALGVPRQEKWISSNLPHFEKGVFMGVGGSFDVIAGTVKRAPDFWVKLNLEWAYRIAKQPSRLKRSLSLPKFLVAVLNEKAKRK
ncbi:WecB/TagA/CpsF family glycosyltransferase [Mangrovibacillus cuniculi]|uniref:N-acetylglucosaminyldiphosphoundecaprenol N-acetyl-beta-D-mannosaminyltransferase n=1 Tax=Mangrovibacillus cuniculi TaxID=2593652 RepID=A0A7S8CCM1_9BACI|nr:WecB/TagA/CpsF family glycosyltransferase [Mangrovibacillus cuniculi]QPC47530.1 WecB/TagA/CpsF family glycosyltransferase [Mangrovibacillus cuniculi]